MINKVKPEYADQVYNKLEDIIQNIEFMLAHRSVSKKIASYIKENLITADLLKLMQEAKQDKS